MQSIVLTEEQIENLSAVLRSANEVGGGYSSNIAIFKPQDDLRDIVYVQTVGYDGTPTVHTMARDGSIIEVLPGFTVTGPNPSVKPGKDSSAARKLLGLDTDPVVCAGSYTEGKYDSKECRQCGRKLNALRTSDSHYFRMPRHYQTVIL